MVAHAVHAADGATGVMYPKDDDIARRSSRSVPPTSRHSHCPLRPSSQSQCRFPLSVLAALAAVGHFCEFRAEKNGTVTDLVACLFFSSRAPSLVRGDAALGASALASPGLGGIERRAYHLHHGHRTGRDRVRPLTRRHGGRHQDYQCLLQSHSEMWHDLCASPAK